MGTVVGFRLAIAAIFLLAASHAPAQEPSKQSLDRQYQSAVTDFSAGRFSQAVAKLEPLLPYATRSFEVHELIGLSYASLSETQKAEAHLKLAVQLAPNSAPARTNFGTLLLQEGKVALAAEQFRYALQLDPESYDANHNLAEIYIRQGKLAAAHPLLAKAQSVNPASYGNGYNLALTDYMLGKLDDALSMAKSMLAIHNTAELHNLIGHIEEKDGRFVEAANAYEIAAHLNPSEDNLFDWGSEMLLHRTYDPAIEIFETAAERYPKSPRMQIGLGLANYFRGKYDEAVKALLRAIDLDPADPRAYMFLARAYDSSPTEADNVIERFKRYVDLKPNDARAQYYYAMSLWKGKRSGNAGADLTKVMDLLKSAIALDDNLADAHLELGDLYSGQHQYEKAIPQYVRALELDANLSDAHYRLGISYVHLGKKEEAQREFAIYQKLRTEHLAKLEKERDEVKQFVYSESGGDAASRNTQSGVENP